MLGLGPLEIFFIFVAILLVFGPKRLPEMGSSLGKAIREFRNAGRELQNDITNTIEEPTNEKNA